MSAGAEDRCGEVALPAEPDARLEAACRIAGALAEAGVQRLELSDPRMCARRALKARESDLPRVIAESEPGTVLAGEGVSLLIEGVRVCWVAGGSIGEALSRLRTEPLA